MLSHVTANIELDGEALDAFTNIQLFQEFNTHQELTITVPFNAMEARTSVDINTTQNKVGKPMVLYLRDIRNGNDLLTFRGLLIEVNYELSENNTRNLKLKCYDPSILLENGPDLRSFLEKPLKNIAETVLAPVSNGGFSIDVSQCTYNNPTDYLVQYRESAFNFLNRLSVEFIMPFFYDGATLYFGYYDQTNVDLVYGIDLEYFQISYKVLPLKYSKYSYHWNSNEVVTEDAPRSLSEATWGEIGQRLFDESHNLFNTPVQSPVMQAIDELSDIADFTKYEELQRASKIKTISGHSIDTELQIGRKINVKIPVLNTNEDQGSYIITSVKHFVSETGQYYNVFEGVTAEVHLLPIQNAVMPHVEMELAKVMDNTDPENKGRVKVQTHWQARDNETTNWVKVMTPDAGQANSGAGNRGLVVIPEVGDTVVIYYGMNDPKRPLVMGSTFTGVTGGGGGQSNNNKSLTSKSGHTIILDDGGSITIKDKSGGNSIIIDGTDTITVTSSSKIVVTNNNCKLSFTDADASIDIPGNLDINVDGNFNLDVKGDFKSTVKGTSDHKVTGDLKIGVTGSTNLDGTSDVKIDSKANVGVKAAVGIKMDAIKMEAKASATLDLKGSITTVEGQAMANVKGGIVNLN